MRLLGFAASTVVLLMASGCEANPILEPDPHGEFDVDLTFPDAHLATLTAVEVEVGITDHDGIAVTDFELVALEHRPAGSTEWTAEALTLHEGHYATEVVFHSSGAHQMRVVAQSHGSDHGDVIHEGTDVAVERVHMEVAGYRVEFETYPGRIHEGEQAEVKFWLSEAADGHQMGGMMAEIHVEHHATASSMNYHADEHDMGVYEAMHTFAEHGETEVAIEFDDGHGHGELHHAAFHLTVGEAH
jgi:hypothetical protein